MLAITHVPSKRMQRCQLTHVERAPIDGQLAMQQHEQYCRVLRACGAEVVTLRANREFPDCAFVEDTAVVLDEVAVMASMGTVPRRLEPAGVEPHLRRYREIQRIAPPATLEGGDVLRVDRTLLVGISSRTNPAGVCQLTAIVCRYGYRVIPIPVRGCLHLKTACTALPDGKLLVNPAWLDLPESHGFELARVPDTEPWAANLALVGDTVCLSASHPRTAEKLRVQGFDVQRVDLSEFAKAEGGVTCLSIFMAR